MMSFKQYIEEGFNIKTIINKLKNNKKVINIVKKYSNQTTTKLASVLITLPLIKSLLQLTPDKIIKAQMIADALKTTILGESVLFETIVKRGNKWLVMNKAKTKVLGTHDSEEKAKKQLAAIEINKHINEQIDLSIQSPRPPPDVLNDLQLWQPVQDKSNPDHGVGMWTDKTHIYVYNADPQSEIGWYRFVLTDEQKIEMFTPIWKFRIPVPGIDDPPPTRYA